MQPLDPDAPKPPSSPLFTDPVPGRSFPTAAVVIAAVAVAILVTVLVLLGRRSEAPPPPNTLLPAAAYAPSLTVSNLQMSESTSMSGGKQTYIEGHIANHGPKTVTGITVQVVFANDLHMAPQIETGPLNLIYMREPYLDTRPVSASPLAPGAESDFRLIFDDVSDNWNQQLPQIRVVQVETH
jgi:hypothetical protein